MNLVHHDLHEEVSDRGGEALAAPGDHPDDASYQEDRLPVPQQRKHLHAAVTHGSSVQGLRGCYRRWYKGSQGY